MVKVSVLMPVFNAEAYLAEAIGSIVNQSFPDWELIVINDGSTDNSEEIILSFNDPRIKYHKNDGNKGIIYTRKLMIHKAIGEYVAFLDSDDVAYPERLQKQVCFLDSNQDYGFCGTWGIMIDQNGNKIKNINIESRDETIRCSLLFSNTFIQSSLMLRRSKLLSEAYNPEYPVAEDYELWCRLASECKMKNIPERLIKYRWHQTNISQSKQKQMDMLVKKIFRRELLKLGLKPTNAEIDVHATFRDTNASSLSDKEFFQQGRQWMKKLAKANKEQQIYNHDIFLATICFRWIYGFSLRKSYSKILCLPVWPSYNGMCELIKMLKNRFLKLTPDE